ncbi:hypothetical protein Dimus_009725 [Dionaea muscipula]
MSRERREKSSPARNLEGNSRGWISVLNSRSHRGNTMIHGRGGRLFTLFVEDIPDSMDYVEMNKMFAKFGVVRDVYLPKKKSMAGKRFGFVRYDCSVAAEVAIQRTNGVWMQDRELKVKFAELHKHQGGLWQRKDSIGTKVPDRVYAHKAHPARTKENHAANAIPAHLPRVGRNGSGFALPPSSSAGKTYMANVSYANVVRKESNQKENVPTINVDTIGNGWLYRSVVASFAEHRSTKYPLDSFMTMLEGNLRLREWGIGRCGCTCHGREDEQLHSSEVAEEDDDVAGEAAGRSLEDDRSTSVSFIVESRDISCAHRDRSGEGFLQGAGCEESRKSAMPVNDEEAHLLGTLSHDNAGKDLLGRLNVTTHEGCFKLPGLGPLGP